MFLRAMNANKENHHEDGEKSVEMKGISAKDSNLFLPDLRCSPRCRHADVRYITKLVCRAAYYKHCSTVAGSR
jgi:hypothetical protein